MKKLAFYRLMLSVWHRLPLFILYVFVYIIVGAIGLPVFSGFRGGIGALMNLTGGYILGFLWSSLFLWLTEKYWINNSKLFILCSVIGLCLCYSFGTYWFLNVSLQNQNILSVRSVLSVCVSSCVSLWVMVRRSK